MGRKIFGKTAKKVAESATKKAATATGEYAGKKAGDKIVELLSKNKTTNSSSDGTEYITIRTKRINRPGSK